ncbi:MAG: DMT family transporter [archaeon]|nr:DMT family transporter [archaeon]
MLPLQTALIGQLSTALGSRSRGISVSYLGGFIVALMVALLWPGQPSITKETLRSVPVAAWASGLLGLVYLAIAAFAIPIVGPAVFFGLVVTGQLTASLTLEQFGLLGTHQHSIDFWRVGGLVLVIVGVVLIRKT